ncbi:hypothetical protein Tco_1149558, partial [Tanacetum coccineum]
MESSSSNSEERELQQMQLEERELHQKCLAGFKKLKIHLGNLHTSSIFTNKRPFENAFSIFFCEEQVTASDVPNKCWQKSFRDGAEWEPEAYKCLLLRSEVHAIKEIEKWLKESELQQQESLVTKSTTLEANLSIDGIALDASLVTEGIVMEACLVTEGATLEACLVNEGIGVNDNTGVMESSGTDRSRIENRSSDHESTSSRNDTDADIGPSYDSDTVTEVPHSSNNTFENVFAHRIQSHEQPESIPDTYKQQHDFFDSLINNLKCDVEKCNEVNREAQQANALLTKELDRYKGKEKHFAKDTTIESEYCKKIKLLNDEISYLKSQACEKDKTFTKEKEKYDDYVQPLLNRNNELEKRNQGFLKQINDLDNKHRKGLGFENQNDYVNPSLLNKAKELAPCLYNIDKMGKDELSDHKIISEEESKCEAEKCLKVKQRKSPLSYHGFVYAETQFEEPQKFPLKQEFFKTQFESAISESYSRVYKNEMFKQNSALENENSCLKKTITQLQNDFSKMEAQSIAFEIALQHKIQENNSLKTIETENENFVASLQIENAHLKQTYKDLFESIQNSRDEPNQCDDVKLKFDFDEIETQNIELEHK